MSPPSDASFTWRELLPPFPDFTSGMPPPSSASSSRWPRRWPLWQRWRTPRWPGRWPAEPATPSTQPGHAQPRRRQSGLRLSQRHAGIALADAIAGGLRKRCASRRCPPSSAASLCLIAALTIGPLVAFVPKAALGGAGDLRRRRAHSSAADSHLPCAPRGRMPSCFS